MLDLDRFKRVVASAEFHKFLEFELLVADEERGRVELGLPYRAKYAIFAEPGNYHGGILASLVDIAGSLACGLKLGRPAPTLDLRIDYLESPARVDLRATGEVRRFGRSVAVADMEIGDAEGRVYCIGRGSFSARVS